MIRKLLLVVALWGTAAWGAGHYVGSSSTGGGGTIPPSSAAANTVWAGPTSGGSGAPSFRTLVTGDIPVIPDTSVSLSTPLQGQSYQSGFNSVVSSDIFTMTPTANQIGINTSGTTMTFSLSPPFIVNNNAASAPTAPTGNAFQYVTQDAANGTWDIDVFGASGRYLCRGWGGTNASQSAVGAAVVDCGLAGRAYDGTSIPAVDEASVQTITSQVQTSTHHGHAIYFNTTTNNTTSSHLAASVQASGSLLLNDSSGTAPTGGDCGAGCENVATAYQVNGNQVTASNTNGGASLSGAVSMVQAYRAEDRMMLLAPSSGSFANNGALTLNVALPATNSCSSAHGGCYMSFPAGAIATGVPAADTWYYTQCTTTTACTVFNNTYTGPGLPTAPGSPTSFSTTGPGAYAATTTALTALQLTIPANSMGTNGRMNFTAVTLTTNSATSKTTRFLYGGTLFAQYTGTTSVAAFFQLSIWNQSATAQVAESFTLGQPTTGATTFATIDTTASQTLAINLLTNNVADYLGLVVCDVEVTQ